MTKIHFLQLGSIGRSTRGNLTGWNIALSLTLGTLPVIAEVTAANAQSIVIQGSSGGFSVQSTIGTPSSIYSNPMLPPIQVVTPHSYSTYHAPGYVLVQPGIPHRVVGGVNNSVLVNPTIINSPIRNSTLINPTIIRGPYHSIPYTQYSIRTFTRPSPQVIVDPQYGVRLQMPPGY